MSSRQLLVEFNDTRTDYPEGKCIHELFARTGPACAGECRGRF